MMTHRNPDGALPFTLGWHIAACILLLTVPACQTSAPPEPKIPPPDEPAEFQPAFHVTPLTVESGGHPDLFSPDSYAVWVGPEVAQLKYDQDVAAGLEIDPKLADAATKITQDFVVVECHIESVFADMSIAYDVVMFRGVSVYLLMPDGRRIAPIQRIIGSPVEEEQRGALKLFRRNNLLVFPRRDLWVGRLNLDPTYPSVKLVLEAQDCQFQFEWPDLRYADPTWVPSQQDALRQVEAGFRDVFGRLRALAHIFD